MRRTDQTRILIERTKRGEKEARERLFLENTGLIYSVIKRYSGRGVDAEDLYQIGSIGLLKAIDHFDTSFDVKFSTYAIPMIMGEIKRFFRDDGIIKVSRSLKENYNRIQQTKSELCEKIGREPTLEEVCTEMQMDMEEFLLSWELDYAVESLQKVIYQSEGSEICLIDKIPDDSEQEKETLDRIYLETLLEDLPPDERKLIHMRYYEEKTQMQIAKELGISQVQVSRLEKRILMKMKEKR